MTAYVRAWRWAVVGVAAVGFASAFIAIAVHEPVFALALLTVTSAAIYVRAVTAARGIETPPGAGVVACIAVALVALIGLVMLLGPVALSILAALAVAGVPFLLRQLSGLVADSGPDPVQAPVSRRTEARCWASEEPPTVGSSDIDHEDGFDPRAIRSLVDEVSGEPTGPGNRVGDQPLSASLNLTASLNTAELCRAWSRSYRALRMSTTPDQVTGISQARRVYLEALEERDPAGVARWLATDPRADGDPTPYLSPSAD